MEQSTCNMMWILLAPSPEYNNRWDAFRAYGMPKRKDGSFGYQRKAAFTEGEIKAQAQFKMVSAAMNSLSEQSREQFHREWHNARYKFNGKKYATLRGYIMARLYAEMKDGVNLI